MAEKMLLVYFETRCRSHIAAGGHRRPPWATLRSLALGTLLFLACFPPRSTNASCNQIPGTSNSFRGALGGVDRPFAAPGDIVEFRLSPSCDAASPGFSAFPMAHVVTVVFEPPNGARNVVALTTDCAALAARLSACSAREDVASATCLQIDLQKDPAGLMVVTLGNERRLRFRFPDTDGLFGGADDDRTFTGPSALAVSQIGAPLPCGLATEPCAAQSGLVACVDSIFATNGTCDESSHPLFPRFTALPPPNNYQAVCVDPSPPCSGTASEFRFTVDADGNLLVPMDWRGVLLGQAVPIARLVKGSAAVEAFPGLGEPVRLPSQKLLASFSPEGSKLPPIFEPQLDPAAPEVLTLFGTVDAPQTVLRVARLDPDAPAVCAGGESDGQACGAPADCPEGKCPAAEPLFDFSGRLEEGVGPVTVGAASYQLRAQDPVPLDGLVETPNLFAFVVPEALSVESPSGGGSAGDLNDDGDLTDEVILLMDRLTGEVEPIGFTAGAGRAATRVRSAPFSFPAVSAEGELAAFLEIEPGEGNRDANGDGDSADSILRVFRLGSGGGAAEVTAGLDLAVDPAPVLNRKSVVVSGRQVFFRGSEPGAATRLTERVSVASDGTQTADPLVAYRPSLSRDGSVVAFQSRASNLLVRPEKDNNSESDVFVHDRRTGVTERVSVTSDGDEAPAFSGAPSLSADGRLTAFHSDAELDLDESGSGSRDVFVHDSAVGETRLAAKGAAGRREPSLNADGRVVAALNNDENPAVFVHEKGKPSERIGRRAFQVSLSADGQVAAFDSDAGDLVSGDTNLFIDVFVYDRGTGLTERVSVSSTRSQANGASRSPSISADGRFVAFESIADNLVAGDTNGTSDVFLRDRTTGMTERVSVGSDGTQGNGVSQLPRFTTHAVSDDGRFVAFESFAANLVGDDGNGAADVFVHDRLTGVTERVSVASDGREANQLTYGFPIALSADGLSVAFESDADNLIDDDENGVRDLFVRGPEFAAGDGEEKDLTGDGDLDDRVLQILDTDSGAVQSLGPADLVVVSGQSAAFLRPEGAASALEGTLTEPAGDLPRGISESATTASFVDVDANGRITDVNVVGLDIAHPFVTDLVLALTSPQGTTVTLAANRGVFGADYVETAFDDEALRPISTGVAPMTGVFRPEDRLAAFDGEDPNGTWTLSVQDIVRGDIGTLESWQLEIETASEEDLNGDGDTNDRVAHIYSGSGAAAENLGRAATGLALSADWLAVLVSEEGQGGTDLNADFDKNDDVVALYNRRASSLSNLGKAGNAVGVAGGLIAFITPEAGRGPSGLDLNGDGDSSDHVLQLYDAEGRASIPVTDSLGRSQAVEEFVLGPTFCLSGSRQGEACSASADCPGGGRCEPALVAFRTSEASQGRDLNGNAARTVDVLQIFDLRERRLINTGQAVTPCQLEACDPRLPYKVGKDTVTFLTLESEQDEDLNNDGDRSDLVLQSFNVQSAAGGFTRAAGGAATFARAGAVGAQVFSAPITTVGSVSAGVCTNTGLPCVADDNCAIGGSCFVPPGGCIKDLARACVPVTGPEVPPSCGSDEFCGPVAGAANQFRCMKVVGACRSNSSCAALDDCKGALCRCADAGQNFLRLIAPLSGSEQGSAVFVSPGTGRCLVDTGTSCGSAAACPAGDVCGEGGTCERQLKTCAKQSDCPTGAVCRQDLVVAAAADSDGDEVTDPFDNCPNVANVDQLDTDLDGVGDVCQAIEVDDTPTPTPTPPLPLCEDGVTDAQDCVTATPTEDPTATPTDIPTAQSTATPTASPGPCVGDCSEDGTVSIDEVVMGVRIALGVMPVGECSSFDCNGRGTVGIDCLVRAVNAALGGGCS